MAKSRTSITPREREYFEFIHKEGAKNFPKKCGCGNVYADESDYNARTEELPGVLCDLEMNGTWLHTSRNCKGNERNKCTTTLGITIDASKNFEMWADFLGYVKGRAQRERQSIEDTLKEVRREYDHFYLPEISENRYWLGM